MSYFLKQHNAVWDPATRKLSLLFEKPTINPSTNIWKSDYKAGGQFTFALRSIDAPIKDSDGNQHVYEVSTKYIVNEGLDSEYSLPDRNVKFRFRFIKETFNRNGSVSVWKDNFTGGGNVMTSNGNLNYWLDGGAYTLSDNQFWDKSKDITDKDGLLYQSIIEAGNNGSGFDEKESGNKTYIYNTNDTLITRGEKGRIHYSNFRIVPVERSNGFYNDTRFKQSLDQTTVDINKSNVLHGKKEDGRRDVIARNVKVDQNVPIDGSYITVQKINLIIL